MLPIHSTTLSCSRAHTQCLGSAILALLVFAFSAPAFAGAWVQEMGRGLAVQQLTYFSASDYYDRRGDKQNQPTFRKLEYQPYLEYGLTPKLTLGASTYLQRDWQNHASNTGLADTEIFLRRQLYRDARQVLSLQPLLKLPSWFADNTGMPRGGSRSTDGEISLLYGRNLNILSARDYSDFRLGYRARSRGLNGQYRADAALGISPSHNWQVTPALRCMKAASLGSAQAFSENGEMAADLLKAETTVSYTLNDRQSIQASLFQHIAGRQTGAGQGIAIGYAVRF